MVKIKWSNRALGELKLVRAFIAQDSEKYAQLTIDNEVRILSIFHSSRDIDSLINF